MKSETKHEAMTRLAAEFESHIQSIRERFYNMPAPESDSLTWGHVGGAGHVVESLQEINHFLKP